MYKIREQDILGLVVQEAYKSPDGTALYLKGKDVERGFERVIEIIAVGDCCSNSWIQHVSGAKEIKAGLAIHLYKKTNTACWNDEEEKLYLCGFYSRGGLISLEIELRNSSNGYYGGWLEFYELEEHEMSKVDKYPSLEDF